MQSTGQTSTQALSLTSMHGSTITYVMVVSPSSAPPLSSGVDDSVPRVCEPPASEPAQGRGLQLTNPLPGQPQDRLDLTYFPVRIGPSAARVCAGRPVVAGSECIVIC